MSDKRNEDLKQFIIPENFMGESTLTGILHAATAERGKEK